MRLGHQRDGTAAGRRWTSPKVDVAGAGHRPRSTPSRLAAVATERSGTRTIGASPSTPPSRRPPMPLAAACSVDARSSPASPASPSPPARAVVAHLAATPSPSVASTTTSARRCSAGSRARRGRGRTSSATWPPSARSSGAPRCSSSAARSTGSRGGQPRGRARAARVARAAPVRRHAGRRDRAVRHRRRLRRADACGRSRRRHVARCRALPVPRRPRPGGRLLGARRQPRERRLRAPRARPQRVPRRRGRRCPAGVRRPADVLVGPVGGRRLGPVRHGRRRPLPRRLERGHLPPGRPRPAPPRQARRDHRVRVLQLRRRRRSGRRGVHDHRLDAARSPCSPGTRSATSRSRPTTSPSCSTCSRPRTSTARSSGRSSNRTARTRRTPAATSTWPGSPSCAARPTTRRRGEWTPKAGFDTVARRFR